MVFVRKKNKKLLVLAVFSLFSTKSFAAEIEAEKKIVQETENFDNIVKELEEIDKQGVPSYASGIFISMPAGLGFNKPFKNNQCEKGVEFGVIGSKNLDLTVLGNFPLVDHVYASAGLEVGNNSLFWDGNKKSDKIKFFSDKENSEKIVDTIYKKAIDSTKVSCWKVGVVGKFTYFFDKFDPRDGINVFFHTGCGMQFCGSIEMKYRESYNGIILTAHGDRDLIGFKKSYVFAGLGLGYQRAAFFYKQYFTSFFDSEKVPQDKSCSYVGCFGFSFDLL